MYCGQCGHALEENAVRCGSCGHEMKERKPAAGRTFGKSPKRLLIGMAALLLLFGLYKLVWGGDDMSSPKATVTGFLKAAKGHDVEAMYSYFVPTKTDVSDSTLDFMLEQLAEEMKENKFKLEDYKITDVRENGNTATVEYMITASNEGKKDTSEDRFRLVKVGKKWYINDNLFDL